jgi:Domain of unknown function (DUF4384)/Papain family cysteine protease
MMKTILRVLILGYFAFGHVQAQGLHLNDSTYRLTTKKQVNVLVRDSVPSKIDLSMYVPSVIDQGQLGTCVGVSTTYYARTILEAIRLGITDREQIDALRFSPSFIYNNIKQPQDNDCSQGTEIGLAMEYLKKNGVIKLSQQEYPHCEANKPLRPSEDSKILDYIKVFGLLDASVNKVLATKKALAEMTPVVIGIQTTPSLDDLGFWGSLWHHIVQFFGGGEEDFGLWKPEKSNYLRGGHAVCVVGYDDHKFGGAFRAVNSRGKYWGDDGFFWIRYTDYPNHAKYAYQAFVAPKNDTATTVLSGTVTMEFSSFNTQQIPFQRYQNPNDSTDLTAYTLLEPLQTNTQYRLSAYLDKTAYLYIINATEPQFQVQQIYPITDSVSALIGLNTKVMLPAEESRLSYRLSPPIGKEYVLFLFSETPIDIHQYVKTIAESSGSVVERVRAAFGDKLVPYRQIKYNDKKMGFTLKGQHNGHIVPLLLTFRHIARQGATRF